SKSGFLAHREHLVAFSPNGKQLAGRGLVLGDGVVRVWNLPDGRGWRDYTVDSANWLLWLGWSAEGEPLAVSREKEALRLHQLVSGRSRRFECKDLERLERGLDVICAVTSEGQVLAVADGCGVVHVWDTATGRKRCTLQPEGQSVRCLSLS